jgi:hypothetical protein
MSAFPVTGAVRILLRVEGAGAAVLLAVLYARTGEPWWLFAVLFLTPDISFAGYLAGPRMGAAVYNAAHVTIGPAVLGATSLLAGWPLGVALALIWGAHIGFDRALGYGLKYPTRFGDTHLGRIGPAAAEPPG